MVKIRETNLKFKELEKREITNRFILHHAGEIDRDFSAEEIHRMHLRKEWSGIGYHFVIRKDGTIERGRPEWAIGAHTQDNNADSIGINLAGDFDIGKPTDAQLDSAIILLTDLCNRYQLVADEKSILGHSDTMPTACPGRNLYSQLAMLREKTRWNQENSPVQAQDSRVFDEEVDASLVSLSAKYESDGNPAVVSSGDGDLGGISYGIYQLSSNAGSVQTFLAFVCEYPNAALANYGKVLLQYDINSAVFINEWKSIGSIDPVGFSALQNAYAKSVYYDQAAEELKEIYYNIKTKTKAMQAVLFSRSVQFGSGNMAELYLDACQRLGYANLSYVDNAQFDRSMISAIYDFLIEECDNAYEKANGLYHSPNDWANGSYSVVKIGLRNRFINEKEDALEML